MFPLLLEKSGRRTEVRCRNHRETRCTEDTAREGHRENKVHFFKSYFAL